jgi:hypothetical protein
VKQSVDMMGYPFIVGCRVVRAKLIGQSPMLTICTVTNIKDGVVYLNDSKQAIRHPERLLIIEMDPMYKALWDHGRNDLA